jgi:hypothetical protein
MHPEKVTIFERLMSMGNRISGTGMNFVAPDNLVRFLGADPRPNF